MIRQNVIDRFLLLLMILERSRLTMIASWKTNATMYVTGGKMKSYIVKTLQPLASCYAKEHPEQ
jgi:hypothetical protein